MSARPGRIQQQFSVPLARPRAIEVTTSDSFNAMKREILHCIRH
jgi:NitT/TauT family transport system ATP-binding protein